VTWWGFTSVTCNAEVTNAFVGETGGSLFQIEGLCRGYDISELSVYPSESELILEPETRIDITAVIKLGPTATLVHCNILPSSFVLLSIAPVKTNRNEITQPSKEAIDLCKKIPELKTDPYLSWKEKGTNFALLCELLKGNALPTKSLNLAYTGIGEEGAMIMAEVFKTNCTLNSVNLTNNNIGNKGVKKICESLLINTSLTELNSSGSYSKSDFYYTAADLKERTNQATVSGPTLFSAK